MTSSLAPHTLRHAGRRHAPARSLPVERPGRGPPEGLPAEAELVRELFVAGVRDG